MDCLQESVKSRAIICRLARMQPRGDTFVTIIYNQLSTFYSQRKAFDGRAPGPLLPLPYCIEMQPRPRYCYKLSPS